MQAGRQAHTQNESKTLTFRASWRILEQISTLNSYMYLVTFMHISKSTFASSIIWWWRGISKSWWCHIWSHAMSFSFQWRPALASRNTVLVRRHWSKFSSSLPKTKNLKKKTWKRPNVSQEAWVCVYFHARRCNTKREYYIKLTTPFSCVFFHTALTRSSFWSSASRKKHFAQQGSESWPWSFSELYAVCKKYTAGQAAVFHR